LAGHQAEPSGSKIAFGLQLRLSRSQHRPSATRGAASATE
jgi:hypothetical protein